MIIITKSGKIKTSDAYFLSDKIRDTIKKLKESSIYKEFEKNETRPMVR